VKVTGVSGKAYNSNGVNAVYNFNRGGEEP